MGDSMAGDSPSFNEAIFSHIFFADDGLIFFRATEDDGRAVLRCLNKYTRAFGQLINYDKSESCFDQKVKEEVGACLARSLGVKLTTGHISISAFLSL